MNKKWLYGLIALTLLCGYFLLWPRDPDDGLTNFPDFKGKKIVAFGDSLTFGYGASDPQFSYPARLTKLLGEEVINLGENGDTTVSALKRIDQVLAVNPGLVLITLGGNDLRQSLDLAETINSLEAIFRKLQENGIAVAYLSIKPPLVGDNWSMAIKDVVRSSKVLWIEDILADLWGNPEFMSDSAHPNDKGYDKVAARVYDALSSFWR